MDSKTDYSDLVGRDMYELYELIRWMGTLRVYPDGNPTDRQIYTSCEKLREKGMLVKEEQETGVTYKLRNS